MKKLIALLMAASMSLALVACGGDDTPANTESGEGTPAANTISVCLASEPDTIDPALNSTVDGATMVAHLFAGLAKWEQTEDGSLVIAPDCAEELVEPTIGEDGKATYVYTIKDGLKWSDGSDLTAKDFEFAWKRAASVELAADYGYMFEVVDGYAEMYEMDADGNMVNPDATLNVTASEDGKTLTVVLANAVPYWNELLAFPTYFPVKEDVVADEAWATDPSTYVCNGPYTLTGWEHNSVITLTKNPDFYDADNITMETIQFFLSDDSNNMLANFENGAWQLIDQVPVAEIANLKETYPDEFFIVGQIGTYYASWNVNKSILPASSTLTGAEAIAAQSEIRRAIGLLFDRNYIVEQIAQAGQVPASSFVPMGLLDADGSEFYQNAGTSSDYDGYWDTSVDAYSDNYNEGIEILKKYYTYDEATGKFTDFPTIEYIYNTDDNHQAIAEYLQSVLANVGITMNLTNQEWNTFLNTRKDGNYTIARNAWLADYNDPISFLDMWTSSSGNNDAQFGKDAHADIAMYSLDLTPYGIDYKVDNGTWAETYEYLISTIKSCTDTNTRYELMHLAEDMLMETGCVMPIYFYTDLYMLDSSVQGFYSNPLGYKYFMHCTIGG